MLMCLYDQLSGGAATLGTTFRHMINSDDPVCMQAAMKYERLMQDSPREFALYVGEASDRLLIYQTGSPFRASTNFSDISAAELKAEPMSVFLQIPGEQMYVARQYMAAIMHSFIEGIAMAKGEQHRTRVLFLANEFTQIGPIAVLRKALRLYRKPGVQFLMYAQSRAAVEEIYGEEGRRDIEENCEFIQILGTDDPGLIQTISTWSGKMTVETHDVSVSGGPTPSVTHQFRQSTRPVLQSEDIRSLARNEQIIKYQNMPLLLAQRRFWKDDEKLREIFEDPADIPGVVPG